jgi:mono/diheme cytochrome c family protein
MSSNTFAPILAALILLPTLAQADPGLLAKYSDGKTTIETVVPAPTFLLKESQSLHPQLSPSFSAEYTGSLKILRGATYTFSAPGATLLIDDKPVTTPIDLPAGPHTLVLRYERKANTPARLQPTWSSDAFPREPLPGALLSHKKDTPGALQQALLDHGRLQFEEHNCAACHKTDAPGLVSRPGPDLSNIGARATATWIFKWLENPRHFRAGAVMPATLTSPDDRRDVAAYLATLQDAKKNKRIPDLKPSQSKAAEGLQLLDAIGCARCHQNDLTLEGQGSKWTSLGQLAAFLKDPLAVHRSGRMPNLMLTDEESVTIANHLMGSRKEDFETPLPAGANLERGQQIVRTAGCLNCHTIDGDAGKPLPAARTFAPLNQLDPSKGCLSADPPATAARYTLPAYTRRAIAAFITSLKSTPIVSPAPAYQWHLSVQRFNCIACHEADQFKPEEGAEVVPPLTNVGAKLKPDWLARVLADNRARVRFWLKTRMPDYGPAVHALADQAIAAAAADPTPEPRLIPPAADVTEGQHLVGANDAKQDPTGMGCVTCHSLREFKPAVAADATRGPELTLMSTRLRADFFHRWMHDPARVQPGTPMPNFFTDKPRDQADRTIDTLWAYASLGVAMPPPIGIKETHSYVLIVTDTPIVQRCQIPDPSGTIVYGISVGLPGLTNYTFDARHCLLRAAWQGGFLDMTGDWADRGGNPVKILGQRFYSSTTPPILLGSPDADLPRTFKGYELKDNIPTFVYTVGDAQIRERITALPEGQGTGLLRTFEIENPTGKPLYFLAPDQPGITLSSSSGPFKSTVIQKTPAHLLELPATNQLTFSVTIRSK